MLRENFVDGMSRVPNSVSVVTTDGIAGRFGVTVSATASVSADPPTLLVCVHHLSRASQAIIENGVFCVNLLHTEASRISDTFAGRVAAPEGDKFGCASWHTLQSGAPVIDGPLVAFDCKLMQHMQVNTHYIFIGGVLHVEFGKTARPLLHANRSYGTAWLFPPA
ncbi:flavin reductase [Noviherbaspirillum saxi]|uniref:Flavin reductase n=1 Tax=Noviherbaspirillum saxi TaxID=2320863 RepID=A0A3A3FHE5_9BURK|nr:flavin reductase [Noviherbaspirillum saxi]RJF91808.1 flavin reductase [Noviherbaspirillum saxi]